MTDVARSGFHQIGLWWHRYKDLLGRIVISGGLIFYFTLAVIHQLPDSPLATKVKDPTRTFCEFLGWPQNWHLFGPEIRNINFHSFGLIGYADGTIGSWEPPRFDKLTLHQKYCKDKFHKWDQDCIPWENYRDFWPGLARYVGRLHYEPKNVPVWFMLLRFEADIPDPRTGKLLEAADMPPHSRLLNAFTYHFQPEDFK
jgi:hypothetical protein